ncbi:hypothetical protein [Aromatoleum sp.]|uniref:hypothetical protein n=1 Tax=Aromatoleum sp. TaxID=2307007 RepID=UPI002FCB8E06
MPDLPFPVIVATLFLFGCLAMLHVHMRQQERLRALPLRDEFLAGRPAAAAACARCTSTDKREFGLGDGENAQRVVVCAKCDRPMYRYHQPKQD